MSRSSLAFALCVGVGGGAVGAVAAGPTGAKSPIEAIRQSILSWTPQTKVERVDHERITTRRLDIVDERGTIRLSLGAPTPAPIIDGLQYKRAFPVSGMTLYDVNGNERGGMGVADVPGSAAVLASDHENVDAIGWRVMPDGSVSLQLNQKPPATREPALDGHVPPATTATTRILLALQADGSPTIAVADKESRPRVRLALTKEGYGAIEFLDASGAVIETLAPEARGKPRPR